MKEKISAQDPELSVVSHGLTLALNQRGSRIVVAGEVDLATAFQLEKFVRGALDAAPDSLLLDLSGVTFIDSLGVRAVVLTARQASNAGIAFTLLCPYANQQVRRVLGILQLSSMMAIVAVDPGPPTPRGSLDDEPHRLSADGPELVGPELEGPRSVRSVPRRHKQSADALMRDYQQIEQAEQAEQADRRALREGPS